MHITRSAPLVAAFVCLAAASAIAGEPDPELMAEVEAIGDVLATSMIEGDAEAMLAMYAEDAISLPNYGPRMEGLETFRRHHAEMAAAGMEIRSFTSSPTEVWACGDQVTEIGTYRIELLPPGMEHTVRDHGSYLTIYERGADGKLRIKVETWNTDMTPMEIAAGGMPGADQHEH